MWNTSCGERTLRGAEARVFAEALLSILEEAHCVEELEDSAVGPPCFDRLMYGQKIAVLSTVGNGLLREDVPVVPLTAVLEGGIAAVFHQLQHSVIVELENPELGTTWREMVAAARNEMEAEDVPEPTCEDEDEWDIEMEELADCVLWDADYECDDLFLDQPPEKAKAMRKETGITEEYFTAIADDLTGEQAKARFAELQELCRRVLGADNG
jgi:hypothetical protein